MSKDKQISIISAKFERRGIAITRDVVDTLRRAEMALHRWAEKECGGGDDYKSWCIERDEQTNVPYMVYYFHDGKTRRYRTPDREQGALKRLQALCGNLGLHFYHQTDPRGCALYVADKPLTDQTYSSDGVAICA